MSALYIKKGGTSHSAYDLRDPNAEVIEGHMLAMAGPFYDTGIWTRLEMV